MLSVQNGHFQIGNRTLLHNINTTLHPSTLYALLGANGCGKSTLLRLLAGRFPPTEGDLLYKEGPLSKLSRQEVAQKISFMPQVFMQASSLIMELSVLDWVLMGCYARDGSKSHTSRQLALQALHEVEMAAFATRVLHTLSQGQRQKIALARLLVMQTEAYLLDEPTAHLDVRQKEWVWSYLQRVSRTGKLVIIATHDVDMARRYADSALLMRQGSLFAQGACPVILSDMHMDLLYRE